MRTITVKGTGNASARPDYIILSLNIEVLSETYDRAMSEAAARIEKMQGVAVRVGYRKEDMKTTSFDVQTRYENVKDRQGNYKREFVGYACTYRLKLAFDFDSKQLANVISAIADCGAQPELSIAFTVKNPARVSEELLISATENARAKAEILCKASGSTLGQLLNIDYNWGELNVYSRTSYEVEDCILVRLRHNGSCASAFTHVILADRAAGVDLTGSTLFLAVTGGQSRRSVIIQQCKQIALIDHVEEVRLILFLVLVDGRIVVGDNEEGVAVFRLNGDELFVGCLVIEQVAGVGVALIVNRLTLRLFRCGSDCGLLFGLSCLRDGKVLFGIIGVGKRRDREARQNHDADRKDGQKTKLLTHCRLPPYFRRAWCRPSWKTGMS